MKSYFFLKILVLYFLPFFIQACDISQFKMYKAVIKDAIVDMCDTFPGNTKLLFSPFEVHTIRRAYQGVFNQIVHVLEEKGDLMRVWIPQVQYHKDVDPLKNSFWADKVHFVFLHDISKKMQQAIPGVQYASTPTIVLIYPWNNFSVGTRFLHIPEKDTENEFAIVRVNFDKHKVEVDRVPISYAIQEKYLKEQECRMLFIDLMHVLLDQTYKKYGPHYEIGYVWGGAAFLEPYKNGNFYQKGESWFRQDKQRLHVTGFDCSGFVMRLAQMAGIDFPWKTTNVMQHVLPKLQKEEKLELGDLIWMPGHVMVVSDIKRNKVIEARGYNSKHGKVHESALSDLFEGIDTYDALLDVYYNQREVSLKDKEGNFYKKTSIKFLKLMNLKLK